MEKYEVKINHQKYFGKDGGVYQRGFNINGKILEGFLNHLHSIVNKQKEPYKKMHLKADFGVDLWDNCTCVRLNLTQTDEFIKFMKKNNIKFNERRANIRANGYLITKAKNERRLN